MSEQVRILALPKLLDPSDRIEIKAPLGSSIDEMITLALPAIIEPDRQNIRVTIGDCAIEPAQWYFRPKIGTCVMIRVVHGNNQVLRNVLTIAVSVAAIALGQFYLGPAIAAGLGFAAGGFAAGATSALVSGTLLIAGTLLINSLVPLRQPKKTAADSPTYSVQGWRNVANPDGVVPLVLGRHRMAPPYAVLPFTVAIGDIVYVYAAFCFGYGPLSITNERIGDLTRIEAYRGVTKELRNGYPGDDPLTIINQQTIEVPLSVNLLNGVQNYRYTARDAAAFSVDLAFPQGLVAYDNRGNPRIYGVNFIISIRKVGTSTWTVVGTPGYSDFRTKAKIATFGPVPLPERGTYEVEVHRNTVDDALVQAANGIQTQSRSDWVAIRSYRPEYPIHFDKPLALSAVVVQATDQLNGTLDAYNADVCSICPDWDVPTQTWIARETNNPASLFRYVLTGPAISYPLGVDEVYAMEDWHEFCASKGLTYNRIHDYEASILDVLSDIAAAGRASPHDNGTAWGVVIDRIIDTVTAHISPRNSWGFQGDRVYPVMPDAFRVSFRDETNFYNPMERIVPRPDLGGDEILVTESIDLPGVTNPDLVWKEARRRWYELFNRPDTYTVSQDFEAIVISRGDKVLLSHDILDRLQVAARVKTVADSIVTLDEEVTIDAALSYVCRFRLSDGTSVLRNVVTHAGTGNAIQLSGAGLLPEPDNLAFFGIAGSESFEAIVKGIETTEHLTARLTLVDAAPQIQTLTDADVPPAWDGRAGGVISTGPSAPPLTPIITIILSGASAGGTDAVPPVEVFLTAASGSPPIADYEVDHRLQGTTSFITVAGAPHSSTVTINGYSPGDVIELRARAVNSVGSSANTAIVTFYVATYRMDRTDITMDSALVTMDAA